MTDDQYNAPLLLDDEPIVISKKLAEIFGINKAAILQQLHFLIHITKKAKNHYNFRNGRWWVYNSYPQWKKDHFTWLGESTIKRLFGELVDQGIVDTDQKEGRQRRNWYTINYDRYRVVIADAIGSKRADDSPAQNKPMIGLKRADDSTETTPEITFISLHLARWRGRDRKPPTRRKANPMYDAVSSLLYGIDPYGDEEHDGRTATISNWLLGKGGYGAGKLSHPATVEQFEAFIRYWKREKPNLNMPNGSVKKFANHWRQWAQAARSAAPIQPRTMSEVAPETITPASPEEIERLMKHD